MFCFFLCLNEMFLWIYQQHELRLLGFVRSVERVERERHGLNGARTNGLKQLCTRALMFFSLCLIDGGTHLHSLLIYSLVTHKGSVNIVNFTE